MPQNLPEQPIVTKDIKSVPIVKTLAPTDYILCIQNGVLSQILVSDFKKLM